MLLIFYVSFIENEKSRQGFYPKLGLDGDGIPTTIFDYSYYHINNDDDDITTV